MERRIVRQIVIFGTDRGEYLSMIFSVKLLILIVFPPCCLAIVDITGNNAPECKKFVFARSAKSSFLPGVQKVRFCRQ